MKKVYQIELKNQSKKTTTLFNNVLNRYSKEVVIHFKEIDKVFTEPKQLWRNPVIYQIETTSQIIKRFKDLPNILVEEDFVQMNN